MASEPMHISKLQSLVVAPNTPHRTADHEILSQLSAISSLIGYIEGGLSVFENSAETPSEDWLKGLRAYCDRASDATEEILAIAPSTANHPRAVIDRLAEDMSINLELQYEKTESGNPIIFVHSKDNASRTMTLFSIVRKPSELYPVSLFSVDYIQKWDLKTESDLYDFCHEYISYLLGLS